MREHLDPIRFDIHYEVDCSCGKFHRSSPSKEALHRQLDKHVEGAR